MEKKKVTLLDMQQQLIWSKKKLGMKEEQIDEVFMDVHVITFSYRGDKDRSVVVFKKERDKDDYVSMIKRKGWHSTLCKN